MQINPLAQPNAVGAASGASGNSNGTSSAQASNDMFLQLLVAQLKSQSPLDPVDPNQFVGQLAQFNTLDQIMQIRGLLQQVTNSIPGTNNSTGPVQGGT